MRILFMVPYPINCAPSQRLKFEQYFKYFEEKGIKIKVCPFVSKNFWKILYKKGNYIKKVIYTLAGYLYRFDNLVRAFNYDLVYVHLNDVPFGPPIFIWFLKFFRRPIIYDIDDVIYLPHSSEANRIARFFKYHAKTKDIIKMSSHVIVVTRYLEEYTKQFNKKVTYIPPTIDTRKYFMAHARCDKKICIGWSGSHSTSKYLSLVEGVFRRIANKYDVRFKVIGDKNFSIPGIDIEAKDWDLNLEVHDIQDIDIGLYPIPKVEWALGKGGLKALQYMGMGIPCVCTRYGAVQEFIEDGINGFLADSEDEWVEKISILIEDAAVRRQIGENGRQAVERSYSVEGNILRYLKILEKVYGKAITLPGEKIRLLFIVPYPANVSPNQRFRYEQYLDVLKANDVDYAVRPFASPQLYRILYKRGHFVQKFIYTFLGFLYRIWNVIEAGKFDCIYICREAFPFGPAFFEWLLARWGKSMIFDFDDSIFLPSASKANRLFAFLKYPTKTAKTIRLCKYVTPGNKFLAEYAARYNKNLAIIPTTIDIELFKPIPKKSKEEVVIGWSGSITTVMHLELLKDIIKTIHKKYNNVRFKVYGCADFTIPGLEVETKNWSSKTELEELRTFDIGVMPLPDDEWARGKCGLKALQYMALGIPTICSPVGVNTEIIEDGTNGFLAATQDEWVEKLSRLIEDPELRKRLGDSGRKTVVERYSKQVNADKFLNAIKAIYRNKPIEKKQRIDVLELITDLDIGGTPTLLNSLIEKFDKTKYRITVCSLKPKSNYSLAESIEKMEIRAVFLNTTKIQSFTVLYKLYLLLKDERIDILHCWLFHSNVLGPLAAKMAKVQCIISSTLSIDVNKSLFRILLDKAISRFTDLIMVNAEAVRDVLTRRERISSSKIVVIRNGIDLEQFKRNACTVNHRLQAVVKDSSPIITSIARLHAVKGHKYLLKAMTKILQDAPRVKLILVGNGPMERKFKILVRRYGIKDNVIFWGAEPNIKIPGILMLSDIFVLPSIEEGLPSSLLEAIGMEVPSIVTNVGGVGEVVKDGESAFVVRPGNSDELAKAILTVLNDPDRAKLIARRARQDLKKDFDMKVMAKRIEGFYDELYALKKGGR